MHNINIKHLTTVSKLDRVSKEVLNFEMVKKKKNSTRCLKDLEIYKFSSDNKAFFFFYFKPKKCMHKNTYLIDLPFHCITFQKAPVKWSVVCFPSQCKIPKNTSASTKYVCFTIQRLLWGVPAQSAKLYTR